MKVFISHSGEKSRKAAILFKEWLPNVIQAVEPWISEDIQKGSNWRINLASALEEIKIGIICLTKSNLTAPWILFEAGALSKTKDANVCTFLLDVKPSDIVSPLADFQHTSYNKKDIKLLLETINDQLRNVNEKQLKPNVLEKAFETSWKEFDAQLKEIQKIEESIAEVKERSVNDMISEVLERIRRMEAIDRASSVITEPIILQQDSSGNLIQKMSSLKGLLEAEKRKYERMKKHPTSKKELSIQQMKINHLIDKIRQFEFNPNKM